MRTHYLTELKSVREHMVAMGGAVLALFDEAAGSVSEPNPDRAARASELEVHIDRQHRLIHDECLTLIALEAPVARDARFVTGVLEAIVDLELIGNYSYEIVTLASGIERRLQSDVLAQISELAKKVRAALATAIDAWRSEDSAQGLSLRSQETGIRAECGALYDQLAQLISVAGEATAYLNLMLISRHLKRLLRHAVCAAEQAVGAGQASGLSTPYGLEGQFGAIPN